MAQVVTSPKLQDAYTDALSASRILFERAQPHKTAFPAATQRPVQQ